MENESTWKGCFDNDVAAVPVPTDETDFSFGSVTAGHASLGSGGGGFTLDDIRVTNAGMPVVTKVQPQFVVGRPPNSRFVRVHSDPAYSIDINLVIPDKKDGYYLPLRQLWCDLNGEPCFQPRRLVAAITVQGEPFVWPSRLPSVNGRTDTWMESDLELAERAKSRWIRVVSNMEISRYMGMEAQGDLPDPQWPNMTFEEMLNNAFRERMITSLDHPILKRLRGESV